MLFSVVICTYNRADGLRQTLDALRSQTFADFEVIVVNGPSTDGTADLLARHADIVKVGHNPQPRLCVSRNIGVNLASGDVVAFLDDDAIPTPTWLAELASAYADPTVGAAGGIVYDHTGTKLQYHYALAARDGSTRLDVEPPLDAFLHVHADPFAHMQGTNMSIRRDRLTEMGGFDENIRHYFDDVEISLQVIDHGHKLAPLPNAAIHHKYLASHVRNANRVVLDPFNAVADRVYFALQHGRRTRSHRESLDTLLRAVDLMKQQSAHFELVGKMTPEQRANYSRRADEGFDAGLEAGLHSRRKFVTISPVDRSQFLRFPTTVPANGRLKLVFLTKEYPPGDFGGPGRYSAELAVGFAAAGHEVHVVTMSPDSYRVDFEERVWVHRLPEVQRWVPDLQTTPLLPNLSHATAAYREVDRIHAAGPVDLVTAPLYLCEGAVTACDWRFPTVHTLITAAKAVVSLADPATVTLHDRQLVAFEDDTVARAEHLHAVSGAILERAQADYHANPAKAFVAALGLRDRREEHPRRRSDDGRIRVLYVGRIEARKGADLFLAAAEPLIREFPTADFVLAGKDTLRTEIGDTLRERFEQQFAGNSEILSRVTFTGLVSENDLYQHYADSDIVCLPSRYESFGLVFVEAMIFGKPVVGPRVGGVPEVVSDGEHGFLVPPGDLAAFTEAVRKLLADAALRTRFGIRSRELYEERFAIPATVTRLETEYRRVKEIHRKQARNAAETVSQRFAALIGRVLIVSPEVARHATERLLDAGCYPVDYPIEFTRLIGLPDEPFVEQTVTLLHGERPGAETISRWLSVLREAGGNRVEFVGRVADRWEAKHNGVPCGMRERLIDVLPTTAMPLLTPPVPPPSFTSRLTRLPKIGKVFEYVRRVVLLPWNFHKMYAANNATHIDDAIRQEVIPLLRELSATQQRLTNQLETRDHHMSKQ